LSAKWRRSKKHSSRFNIFRVSHRAKNKKTPQKFRPNLKVKRQIFSHKYRDAINYKGKGWKEPEPLTDVFEDKNEIVVVADFAGFQKENIRVHVKNQRLTLSAEALDRKYYKSLNLPKRVIPNNLHTTYKNGVLEIRLKKAAEEAMSKIVG